IAHQEQDYTSYNMTMGHNDEKVANRFSISREDQDAFAVQSHERAAKAIKEEKFNDEIVPVEVSARFVGQNNKIEEKTQTFETDEGVRPGTTMDVLGKLRTAFNARGTVTAGNS